MCAESSNVNVKYVPDCLASMHKRESDYVTGVYRCKDPIKNFKIRIRLHHERSTIIPLPQGAGDSQISSSHQADGGEIDERIFSWQEKVFSPFELSYYRYAGNCHTALEEKYHKDVTELCKNGLSKTRLFTYTDADDFVDVEEVNQSVTTGAKVLITPLVEGVSQLRHKQGFGHKKGQRKDMKFAKNDIVDYKPSMELKRRNHFLQTSLQMMYILADLSTRESDESWVGKSEYVLCIVRWDSLNEVLTVTPDFTSTSLSESAAFSMEPYRIEVDDDARNTYRYWTDHVSANISPEDKMKELTVINKLYDHQLHIRQLQIGTDFEVPRQDIFHVQILGEISSAEDFEYDNLFIHYFFELPKGWSCDKSEHLSGVTQTCNTRRTGTAYFSYPFEVQLVFDLETLNNETDILSWPQLFLEVLSLDSWSRFRTEGYGYIVLPPTPGYHDISISTWRPISSNLIGEMRRFFIGGSPELEDPTFVGVPPDLEGSLLSKYGVRTVANGTVKLKLYLIHQSTALITEESAKANKQRKFLLERLSTASLINSVNAVLTAFKQARERMLRGRENLLE